jgi:hypothetical protein
MTMYQEKQFVGQKERDNENDSPKAPVRALGVFRAQNSRFDSYSSLDLVQSATHAPFRVPLSLSKQCEKVGRALISLIHTAHRLGALSRYAATDTACTFWPLTSISIPDPKGNCLSAFPIPILCHSSTSIICPKNQASSGSTQQHSPTRSMM